MQIAEDDVVFFFVAISIILLLLLGFIASLIYSNKINQIASLSKFENLKDQTEEALCRQIAREIHDNILHQLSISKNNLKRLEPVDKTYIERINFSVGLLDESIVSLREMSQLLASNKITKKNLPELIEAEFDSVQKLGYTSSLNVIGIPISTNILIKKAILRIIQESLRNIINHSDAKNITCVLTYHDEILEVLISDDGKGFDYSSQENNMGSGIYNITARTEELNGIVKFISNPNSGTTIHLKFPIKHETPTSIY